jgi:hypothetical protein
MEEEPQRDGNPRADGDPADIRSGPERPEVEGLADEADALREMIDAGASSPEELRALAERLREHREREEAIWRAEVRPSLMRSKKRSYRAPPVVSDVPPVEQPADRRHLLIGLGLLVGVLVIVVLASQSSVLLLLVPVVGVLVYAYVHGKRGSGSAGGEDPPPGSVDTLGP